MAYETIVDESISLEQRMRQVAPVLATHKTYFSLFGETLGAWGEPKAIIEKR